MVLDALNKKISNDTYSKHLDDYPFSLKINSEFLASMLHEFAVNGINLFV